MAVLCRNVNRLTNLMEQFLIPLSWPGFIRLKFTKARIPEKMFEVEPSDHEKYSGDPDQPHQLHIITRIKCTKRRPYWEKKIVHDLGLDKQDCSPTLSDGSCSLPFFRGVLPGKKTNY